MAAEVFGLVFSSSPHTEQSAAMADCHLDTVRVGARFLHVRFPICKRLLWDIAADNTINMPTHEPRQASLASITSCRCVLSSSFCYALFKPYSWAICLLQSLLIPSKQIWSETTRLLFCSRMICALKSSWSHARARAFTILCVYWQPSSSIRPINHITTIHNWSIIQQTPS